MGAIDEAAAEISKTSAAGKVVKDAPMRSFTTFRAGGNADYLFIPDNEDELLNALAIVAGLGAPFFILGNGANLLVRDGGFRGIIIHIGKRLSHIKVDGCRITAKAGALLSEVAAAAADASLTGLEFAAGIPGSVGGAVFMNAGAFDGEIKQAITGARVVFVKSATDGRDKDEPAGIRVRTLSRDELDLSYRHSSLSDTGGVVIDAALELDRGEPSNIRGKMAEFAQRRMKKQPLGTPSAGSFFKRPEGHYAGKLIQDAGLAGRTVGGAQVSCLHAGFIINRGGASATDITELMEIVRDTVYDRFGVLLEPEVRIIGEV
jgi:UDP-N-acetylmuramate dehydrogenase